MRSVSPFDLHVHLYCEEMESRDTPAVLAPMVTAPMDGGGMTMAVSSSPSDTTTPPGTLPSDGNTNTPGIPTTAGTSSGTAVSPNVNNPFGSFALSQPNPVTLNSPNNATANGFSLLSRTASGSLLVSTYANEATAVFIGSGVGSRNGDAAGTSAVSASSLTTSTSGASSNSSATPSSGSSGSGTTGASTSSGAVTSTGSP